MIKQSIIVQISLEGGYNMNMEIIGKFAGQLMSAHTWYVTVVIFCVINS